MTSQGVLVCWSRKESRNRKMEATLLFFFPPAAQRHGSCSMTVFRITHLLKNADSHTPSPTFLFF